MESYDKNIRVAALSVEKIEGNIWFSAVEKNGIFVIDDSYKEVRFVKYFENEQISQDVLYAGVRECNGKLIFSPNRANRIAIYDIENDEMQYFDIPEIEVDNLNEVYDPDVKFGQVIVEDDVIYILGYSFPGIIKIKDKKLTVLNDWVELLNDKVCKGDKRGYTSEGYIKRGRELYIPSGCCNCVVIINMDSDKTTIKEIPCCFDGLGGMSLLPDGRISIIGRGKNTDWIVFWDMEGDNYCKLHISENLCHCDIPFYSPIVYKKSIFLFPLLKCDCIYRIGVDDLSVEQISIGIADYKVSDCAFYPWVTMGIYVEDNIVGFITGKDLMWHQINLDTYEIVDFEIKHEGTCKAYYEDVLKIAKENKEIVNEDKVPIQMFLSSLI